MIAGDHFEITGVPFNDSSYALTEGGRKGATLMTDLIGGYTFSLHSRYRGKERWCCSRKKNLGCQAVIKLHNGVVYEFGQHCHPAFKSQ